LPDYRRAEKAAEKLLEKYGYQTAPIDPEVIAEAEGVDVVYAGFAGKAADEVSGFINPNERRIFVNREIPPNRKTFTIAHELGHYMLHRDYTESGEYRILPRRNEYGLEKPVEEKEADVFAANLLVPMKLLKRYKAHASVPELARMFLVSQDVILHRLKRA
jgi:Zn-dependent peptidase ImmA (M78 family)